MKLCWDTIDGIRITKGGYFYKDGRRFFTEEYICKICQENFLASVGSKKLVCTRKCSVIYTNITKYKNKEIEVGQEFGWWTVIKDCGAIKGNRAYVCKCRCGKESSVLGCALRASKSKSCGCRVAALHKKERTIDISNIEFAHFKVLGKAESDNGAMWECLCDCGKKFITRGATAIKTAGKYGCGCGRFKLGEAKKTLIELGIVDYEYYKNSFGNTEKISYRVLKEYNNFKQLISFCAYCNKEFAPTQVEVVMRLRCLEGKDSGEGRLYCSDGCKKACPIFNTWVYPKGFKGNNKVTSREVQPELRKMVLERDNWTCQYGACGKTVKDCSIHCHHMEGINQNPIESADIDMCISFCEYHHKKVHKQKDCRYVDLRCKNNG